MQFDTIGEAGPRPLGNLRKPGAGCAACPGDLPPMGGAYLLGAGRGCIGVPGAGVIFTTMSVGPSGARPLLTENVARAESAAYMVAGGPDFQANPGMIHEYNLLVKTPGFVAGSYNPTAYAGKVTTLLASIAELVRLAWVDLTDYLVDAQGVVLARVADLLDERTPPNYREAAIAHLNYYSDELTAIGPQLTRVAALLDVAGQIVEDKIRAFKSEFARSRLDLLAALKSAVALGVQAARDAANKLETPAKWATVAVAGIAVVALVGAAIYFVPRPRRR